MKNREPSIDLDNRGSFNESVAMIPAKPKPVQPVKCGEQLFINKIVGGEICELDEFPWAALLLYDSSEFLNLRRGKSN